MFSPALTFQRVGVLNPSAMPLARGPRNDGQSTPARGSGAACETTKRRRTRANERAGLMPPSLPRVRSRCTTGFHLPRTINTKTRRIHEEHEEMARVDPAANGGPPAEEIHKNANPA